MQNSNKLSFNIESIECTWGNIVSSVREEYTSNSQQYPWIIGFSGGKDSTVVAQAVFEALLSVSPSLRTRPVHVVSNDTLVESPLVIAHLDKVAERIEKAAKSLGLPITVARTKPLIEQSFWVLLIGKGYPSPNITMRWCTDRLKIQPTSNYIKRNISECGSAIVVLGVRRSESNTRQRSIDSNLNLDGTNLTPHKDLPGAYIYRPIVDLSTDDVWEILATYHAPWGGTHRELIQLYRDAEGGECPVVLSKDDAPSCGTSNSRFGCWTCTVIEKDNSLQGFIDGGKHEFQPLVIFRNWLKEIRNNPEMRQGYRRNGKLTFNNNGNHIPGPFTIQARKQILDYLLQVQTEFGAKLISDQELDLIYQHWTNDLQQEKEMANG